MSRKKGYERRSIYISEKTSDQLVDLGIWNQFHKVNNKSKETISSIFADKVQELCVNNKSAAKKKMAKKLHELQIQREEYDIMIKGLQQKLTELEGDK